MSDTVDTSTAALLTPDAGFAEQVKALYSAGMTIERIANALKVPEMDVKTVIIANKAEVGALEEVEYTRDELLMIKMQTLRLALSSESDSVRAGMAKWILERSTVSKETRFKAAHGMRDSTTNTTNIMLAIQAAKEKADQHE